MSREETGLPANEWSSHAHKEERDRRRLRWALGAAIAVHAVLFALKLPEMVAEAHEIPKKDIFVVPTRKFKPPETKPQETIPEPRKKKVPMPDPTPDAPEPLRSLNEIQPVIAPLDADVIYGEIPAPPPEEPPRGPVRTGGQVAHPEKLFAPMPPYPEMARRARITGKVILDVILNEKGLVESVAVLKGQPLGLTEAAVETVKTWRFEPPTLNGKPVSVLYALTINFELH